MNRAKTTETVVVGRPLAGPADPATGSLVGDRYELCEPLGRGGFAVVYRARDRIEGREVAVKLLRRDRLTPADRRRFRREAAVAAALHHPNLVPVLDAEADAPDPYLVLPLVGGTALSRRLESGPLPIDHAVELAGQVAAGLAALHRAGIVHRDVTAANVLLGDDGRARLGDFGLALRPAAGETRPTATGQLVGTVEYLAPEQAVGDEPDPRSDLYSLGVLLFEMLTGEVPHRARSSLGTLLAHLQRPAPDPRSLRPEVPAWLARVVARLLARDPAARYSDGNAVRRDLRSRRARRTLVLRRRPAVAATAVLLALAALWTGGPGPTSPQLAQVVERDGGLVGVGADGVALWRIEGRRGPLVPARLAPGETARRVGVLVPPGNPGGPRYRQVLSVVHPTTGAIERRVALPSAALFFPDFSDRYGTNVRTIDIDRDGIDEVLVTFFHQPYWPSWTVLWEPRLDRVRTILVASGHHRPRLAVDLDGDGDRELLLVGINNQLGYSSAAVAVRLEPPVGRPSTGRTGPEIHTPDSLMAAARAAPVWYALLPRTLRADPAVEAIPGRGLLRLAVPGGAETLLDYHGFDPRVRSDRTAAERQALRHRAFEALREARRLDAGGLSREAVFPSGASVVDANEAGDPRLAELAERLRGQILVRAGALGEAAELFERIAAASAEAPEIAYDAATAYYLAGRPAEAAAWFRRGLGVGGSEDLGRGKYEFLEGLVFALEEQGAVGEALLEIERYLAADRAANVGRGGPFARILREFLRLRSGRRPSAPEPGRTDDPDVMRYLRLEILLAREEPLDRLAADVERELSETSDCRLPLLALAAEVDARRGLADRARERIDRAYEGARAGRGREVYLRAFYPLIEERHARVTGARGT